MLPILNQSLWRDEAFSALLSEKNPLQIITLTMRDVSPPLYYILLHYWMLIFGNNEVTLRTFSFLFHILGVVVIYLIAKKLIPLRITHILIPFTMLLNPFLLQYAFEARPYSLLVFLTLLAVYCIAEKKLLLASIVLGLSILTHNFALFNVCAIGLWWLYVYREKNKILAMQLFSFPLLAMCLWGGVVWNQWSKVAGGFWIKQTTSSVFLRSLETYTKGDLSYFTQPMLYTFSLLTLFFAFSYWVWHERKEENPILFLFFSLLVVPTTVTYFISALFTPIYHERYLISAVPMLIFLAGYSLCKLVQSNPHIKTVITVVIAIYIILLVQASEEITGTSTKPSINWGIGQIASKAREGDSIVPKDILNFLEAKYYVQQSGKHIPVYAYAQSGKIPFYVGNILYEPQEIITSLPKNHRIWQIEPDGGYKLLQ